MSDTECSSPVLVGADDQAPDSASAHINTTQWSRRGTSSVVSTSDGGLRQYPRMEPAVELRQLRYFVAVAEELHFGRAAERLHMSQSPLSRAIRDLERDLGVVLFVRTTRRVELTEAGTVLLRRARPALAEIDGAIADTRRADEPNAGILAIGSGP